MRPTQEIVPRAVKVRPFPFLKQPVNTKKWTKDAILRYLSGWCERQGHTVSHSATPVLEALASEYRRLILADWAMERLYEQDEPQPDALVKNAAVIDKTEVRVRRAWEQLGLLPLVRRDSKAPAGESAKVLDFSRKTA